MGQSSPLLSTPKLPYSMFSRVFSLLRKEALISGNYSSHSLRRGGATFMSNKGMSLHDIKAKGLWKSDAVNRYIVPSLEACKQKKFSFSSVIWHFWVINALHSCQITSLEYRELTGQCQRGYHRRTCNHDSNQV